MRVLLRSVVVNNFESGDRAADEIVNLPGCLETLQGQPLIVGVFAGSTLSPDYTRIWYLSGIIRDDDIGPLTSEQVKDAPWKIKMRIARIMHQKGYSIPEIAKYVNLSEELLTDRLVD